MACYWPASSLQETGSCVVGIWNLIDDLDPNEARALGELIERWWDRPFLSLEIDHLCLLGAGDDLALDSSVEEALPLSS